MKSTLVLALTVCASVLSSAASAQTFPSRPVKLIVPFPAGGPTDVQARIVAQEMGNSLGHSMVVENRAGAGGNVAAEFAAKSSPDGYTVFFATGGTHGINPNLYKKPGYDPVRDFDPVIFVATSPNVFVAHPDFPANTIAELIAYAKSNPKQLDYAIAGLGATTHMSAELLQFMTGIGLQRVVYRGGAQAMNDLVGGHIKLMVDGLPSALPLIKQGSIKALGVTSVKRDASAGDIPAVAETVPGYETTAWYGLVVPKGTPGEIISALNKSANTALRSAAVMSRYAELGASPIGGTPEDLERQINAELKKWADVVKATGTTIE